MAAADVLPPEPEDRVLGASTADQVLERWHGFLAESSQLLKAQLDPPALQRRLPARRQLLNPEAEAGSVESASSRLHLASTPLGRVVYSLAASVQEARRCIRAAPELYRAVAVFGEARGVSPDEDSLQTPPELLVEFAQLLPQLRAMRQLLRRVEAVAVNLLRQLAGQQAMQASQGLQGLTRQPLRPVLDVLSELLLLPVHLDGLALENGRLRRTFASYSWIVTQASTPGSALPEVPQAAALKQELQEAAALVQGDAFQICLANICQGAAQEKLEGIREHFLAYFRGRLEEEPCGPVAASQLWLPREALVPWVCCFVLHVRLFTRSRDEVKLLGEAWKMHKKSPSVVLYGRVVWCLGDFVQSYLPELVAEANLKKELEDLSNLRLKQAERLDDGSFIQEMQSCRAQCAAWLGAPKRKLQPPVSEALAAARRQLQGLQLALRIRSSLEEYLVLHVREGAAVPRSALPLVALGFQLLKTIEAAEWDPELGSFVEQQLALRLQQELQESRAKLRPQQRSEAPAEALRLAGQAQRILATEPAEVYSDIGAIALALCCAGRSEPANAGISGRWREMRVASTWQQHLARLCDTTWCYWLRDLLPMLLAEVSAAAVQPLFVAFAQPLTVLPEGVARHSFLRELREVLEASVVQPLCAKVEEDLRLLVHATMQGTREALPAAPPEEVLGLLQLRPLRLSDAHVVDLRDQVELRLSRHFYDLAALAPQDAEAYARMREAAAQRYGLHLLDGGLPAGSLAQGLDVIDVMRNVHLLATQYCYCLHQQFFTQAFNQGEAKVRTITVEHLAASIRVHGYGVINTAVNYSVGFLKKKLEVVAQFLADESVKSRLLTEKQWMEGRQGYSWARAVETARFVRRLGAGRDGVSYLDKLRQVLTQIGNSLGYVRMIRTAGMRSMANGLEYLEAAPWLGDGGMSNRSDLAQAAEAAGCDPPVQEAARLAEAAARSVRRCFEASTDHLNLLAEVFAKALSRPEAMPTTRLFHLLVPSVGCAFLDSLLLGRETLAKRAVAPSGVKGEALLTDDGFAVGVAFVLRVFGLQRDFQSLHWFQTEINDSDMTTGQARAAAGLPFQESRGEADRRSKLAAELSNLAAALEASGALFGAAKTPAREEPVVESEAVES